MNCRHYVGPQRLTFRNSLTRRSRFSAELRANSLFFRLFCVRHKAKYRCRRAARVRAKPPAAPRRRRRCEAALRLSQPSLRTPQRRDGLIVRAVRYARSSTDFSQERRRQAIQEPIPITAPKTKSEVQKTAVFVVTSVRSQM